MLAGLFVDPEAEVADVVPPRAAWLTADNNGGARNGASRGKPFVLPADSVESSGSAGHGADDSIPWRGSPRPAPVRR